ncbi:hypothetical protein [Micromonospora sp. NPDC048830]|uniref:hypothetical protein n=1 Tax=Micromonospora sp. NPDC048830 TaxID=3364257 RepID=UPI00371DB8CB
MAETEGKAFRAFRRLVIIGGSEGKARDDSEILKRFVRMAGGGRARIVVISTASAEAGRVDAGYVRIFKTLGVEQACPLRLETREQANGPRPSTS